MRSAKNPLGGVSSHEAHQNTKKAWKKRGILSWMDWRCPGERKDLQYLQYVKYQGFLVKFLVRP